MTTTAAASTAPPETAGGVGADADRPDGAAKVTGAFAYASDLAVAGMLWGATARSPHPHARIRGIDTAAALAIPGVVAVLTAADVPGDNRYGLEHADQPVLADTVVRYQGEPVGLVAARDPHTARRAAAALAVDYEILPPVTDPQAALAPGAPPLHPGGNLVRHLRLRTGPADAAADVVVTGDYEIGQQDQAFLGPEAGLAIPDGLGGVDLHVATQWLHVDQAQIARALGLAPGQVRLTLAGVGGAFGGREDLSMHVHGCLLALRTGRPVKMVYGREESFVGHVHRHPMRAHYEHGLTADGHLVFVNATMWLDAGAYTSSSPAVIGNAGLMGVGPYQVERVAIDAYGAFTTNPPAGAMRGFGAVQAAYCYEAQMDKAAAALGIDPVALRVRNAMTQGARTPNGQVLDSPAPVAELLRRVHDAPLPTGPAPLRPGGLANTSHGEGIRRGVGYAVAYKNIGFSEGIDDSSTARVRLELAGGQPVVTVHSAAAEVGQGLVTVLTQIARTELGVGRVVLAPADTGIGSAGSTSASRQTYVTGGAVRAACEAVRDALLARAGSPDWTPTRARLDELLADGPVEQTVTYRHRPTTPVDPQTGQGFAHMQYAFSAHRAVVDVDVELGLVHVVELACAQDVGRAINPRGVVGQIHGGSVQGMGLAVMEELVTDGSRVLNPSFTDYLIPTILDAPAMPVDVLELPDPHAPYGLRGVGEPPTISSGPAVLAAIRAATGAELHRVPVRPEHLTGTAAARRASAPAHGSRP